MGICRVDCATVDWNLEVDGEFGFRKSSRSLSGE